MKIFPSLVNCFILFFFPVTISCKLLIAFKLFPLNCDITVPIIPAFLYEIHHNENQIKSNASRLLLTTTTTTTNSPREVPILIPNQLKGNNNNNNRNDQHSHGGSECTCPLNEQTTTSSSTSSSSSYEIPSMESITPEKEAKQLKHKELVDESTEVGVLFASKPVIQAITNPFIGPMTNR